MFLTQEIGSIQRPLWRQKLDSPPNLEWIKEAEEWGKKLGVSETTELLSLLRQTNRTPEEKERIVQIASLYVVRMFEQVGLDRVFNGEQPRTEMYDFLAAQTNGVRTSGVLNSFDANYFKKGVLEGPLGLKLDGLKFFVSEFNFVKNNTKKVVKPCLTGAYTMTDWSYVEYHRRLFESQALKPLEALRKGRREASLDFARNVLNPVVRALAKAGASVIQIDEPAASTREEEFEVFVESVNEAFKGVSVEKAVHLCYSNYPTLFPALAECVADTYLIEFTNHASTTRFQPDQVNPESFKAIELFKEYGMNVNVGVGVIDIHSDLVETPKVVKERLLYAEKLVGDAERVQVNPDCGLRTRKWDVAYAKLKNMVEGAQLAREELGG